MKSINGFKEEYRLILELIISLAQTEIQFIDNGLSNTLTSLKTIDSLVKTAIKAEKLVRIKDSGG